MIRRADLVGRSRPMGALFGALLVVSGAACGKEVPHGGVLSPADLARAPRVIRRLTATDVLPKDLDFVVRVDVARMRSQLGPLATTELEARAIDQADDELLLGAISRADIVWVGLRLSDLARGDRVIVVEGRFTGFTPNPLGWTRAAWSPNGARVFDRVAVSSREKTARIVALNDCIVAFMTPVEVDSVARVLRDGPDEERGEPSAEGLVSLDLHRCHLPDELERRYAALAALARGLRGVRATASLDDPGLVINAELRATSPEAAAKVHAFLDALRSDEGGGRLAAPIRGEHLGWPKLEQVDETVHLGLVVPRALLLGALAAAP